MINTMLFCDNNCSYLTLSSKVFVKWGTSKNRWFLFMPRHVKVSLRGRGHLILEKKNLVFSLTLATNLLFTQKFPLVNHLKCLKVV